MWSINYAEMKVLWTRKGSEMTLASCLSLGLTNSWPNSSFPRDIKEPILPCPSRLLTMKEKKMIGHKYQGDTTRTQVAHCVYVDFSNKQASDNLHGLEMVLVSPTSTWRTDQPWSWIQKFVKCTKLEYKIY